MQVSRARKGKDWGTDKEVTESMHGSVCACKGQRALNLLLVRGENGDARSAGTWGAKAARKKRKLHETKVNARRQGSRVNVRWTMRIKFHLALFFCLVLLCANKSSTIDHSKYRSYCTFSLSFFPSLTCHVLCSLTLWSLCKQRPPFFSHMLTML